MQQERKNTANNASLDRINLDQLFIDMIIFSIDDMAFMIEKTHIMQMKSSIDKSHQVLNLSHLIFDQNSTLHSAFTNQNDLFTRYLQLKKYPEIFFNILEPIEIIQIPAKTIKPLPILMINRIRFPFLQAISIWNESIAFIINPSTLIESKL